MLSVGPQGETTGIIITDRFVVPKADLVAFQGRLFGAMAEVTREFGGAMLGGSTEFVDNPPWLRPAPEVTIPDPAANRERHP